MFWVPEEVVVPRCQIWYIPWMFKHFVFQFTQFSDRYFTSISGCIILMKNALFFAKPGLFWGMFSFNWFKMVHEYSKLIVLFFKIMNQLNSFYIPKNWCHKLSLRSFWFHLFFSWTTSIGSLKSFFCGFKIRMVDIKTQKWCSEIYFRVNFCFTNAAVALETVYSNIMLLVKYGVFIRLRRQYYQQFHA